MNVHYFFPFWTVHRVSKCKVKGGEQMTCFPRLDKDREGKGLTYLPGVSADGECKGGLGNGLSVFRE